MVGVEEEQRLERVGSKRLVAAKMVMLDAPFGAGLGDQLKILEGMSDEEIARLNMSIDKEAKDRLR